MAVECGNRGLPLRRSGSASPSKLSGTRGVKLPPSLRMFSGGKNPRPASKGLTSFAGQIARKLSTAGPKSSSKYSQPAPGAAGGRAFPGSASSSGKRKLPRAEMSQPPPKSSKAECARNNSSAAAQVAGRVVRSVQAEENREDGRQRGGKPAPGAAGGRALPGSASSSGKRKLPRAEMSQPPPKSSKAECARNNSSAPAQVAGRVVRSVRAEENREDASQQGGKRKSLADIYPVAKRREVVHDPVRPSIRGDGVVFSPVLRTGPPDMCKLRQSLQSTTDKTFQVRQILKFFDSYRRYLLLKENSGKAILETRQFMQKHGLNLNQQRRSGAVPGVEVGQQFYYRWEMMVVGLHFTPQAGIDTRQEKAQRVATSIVFSGGYEDDVDRGVEIEYTGEGGSEHPGTGRQRTDQELKRGNLAMKVAYDRDCLIRVTRRHDDEKSPSKHVYTYDGLYRFWKTPELVQGISGYKVFKFYLRRIEEQPPLLSNKVFFHRSKRKHQIANDISKGLELLKIPAVNALDKESPPDFKYVSTMSNYPNCMVKGAKRSCKNCPCDTGNENGCPYTPDGTLVRAQPVIYECNKFCHCKEKGCPNRVSQKGMKFQLEVFKTKKKGWGVRPWESIPPGSFICEFAGELIDRDEFERREGNDLHMFSLDFWQGASTRWGTEFEQISAADSWKGLEDFSCWYIDANKVGSVARFINHSCAPNAFVQYVLYDHSDMRFPHVMIFAAELIPAFTEITLDYGLFAGDNVTAVDASGKPRSQACYCGSAVCKKRVY